MVCITLYLYTIRYFPILRRIRSSVKTFNTFISPCGGFSVSPSMPFFIRNRVVLSRLLINFTACLLYIISNGINSGQKIFKFYISLISNLGIPITLQCSRRSPSINSGIYEGLIGTSRSQFSPCTYSTFFIVAISSSYSIALISPL